MASVYQIVRAEIVRSPTALDLRDKGSCPLGKGARDMFDPALWLGSGIIPGQPTEGIKVKPRDFR